MDFRGEIIKDFCLMGATLFLIYFILSGEKVYILLDNLICYAYSG